MEVIEETGNEGIKISIVQDHPVFTDFCILVCDETGDNQILSIIEVKKPEVYASLTLPTKAVAQVLREAQIRLCEIVSTISLPSQVIATIQQVRKLHCPPVKQSSTFRGFALVVPAHIFFLPSFFPAAPFISLVRPHLVNAAPSLWDPASSATITFS